MPSPKPIVYVDANVVIEAHRAGCWRTFIARYDVRTTRECWRELGRGDPRDSDYVPVDTTALASEVVVCDVTTSMLATAITRAPSCAMIHRGERELLAWVAAQSGEVLLMTTADRAAVKSACRLGLDTRLISLEELAERSGCRPALRSWFCKRWLSQVKTEVLLEDF